MNIQNLSIPEYSHHRTDNCRTSSHFVYVRCIGEINNFYYRENTHLLLQRSCGTFPEFVVSFGRPNSIFAIVCTGECLEREEILFFPLTTRQWLIQEMRKKWYS